MIRIFKTYEGSKELREITEIERESWVMMTDPNLSLIHIYPSGEAMFEEMIEDLKKAKYYIFMEFFIVEEGYMWNTILEILKERVDDGVEVRFMYDDVG